MVIALYAVFLYAPTEATMGTIQRIFYFHVSSGWLALFVAFPMVFVGSLLFLLKHDLKWDRLASCSAEIGVVFTSLVLITGPIWAKPVWGIWWTWDARLTSSLVLWLIYVAYLMLRAYIADPTKKASLSAVFGILGFVDVPIVFMSIRWWRTQHPAPVMFGSEGSGLDSDMAIVLTLSLLAFTLLYVYLLEKRLAIERIRQELDELEHVVQTQ